MPVLRVIWLGYLLTDDKQFCHTSVKMDDFRRCHAVYTSQHISQQWQNNFPVLLTALTGVTF